MNGKRHRRGCAIRAAARASVPGALITRTVYVVDTSVLLADPLAVTRFAEHEVVLPLVVLTELEGKRHHPELGWAARQSLRFLEELRTRHGSLLDPMPVNELGGTLRVELNHQELEALPQPLMSPANDHRILAVALSLGREGRDWEVVAHAAQAWLHGHHFRRTALGCV